MDFFDQDMFEKGMKFQKNMMDQYMNAMDQFTDFFKGKSSDDEKEKSVYSSAQEAAEAMMQNADSMNEFLRKSYQEAWDKWMDFSHVADGFRPVGNFDRTAFSNAASLMEKFMNSMSVYTKVFDFWKECIAEFPEDEKDPYSAASKYAEKSEKLLQELLENIMKPIMSEDAFSFLDSYVDLGKTIRSVFGDFMAPWTQRRAELLECIRLAATGDKDAYPQYMALVSDAYEESFGKLLSMNGIGIVKDKVALNLQMMDSYIRMMMSYFEMSVNVQNILRDANTELWKKIQEITGDSEKSMTFKEFYDMWIKVNSEAINKFYFTDEFAEFMGEYANNAYDFKKKSDEFLESILSVLPVPTDSEMKSVYKTVYELRKDIRDLKKEVAALRAQLDDAKQEGEE